MIKLTEKWSVYRDRYQWVLVETYVGKDRKGNPKEQEKEHYFPWLSQALRRAADRDCENAVALSDIESRYNAMTEAFIANINHPDRSALELHARCKDLEGQVAGLQKQLRAAA